MLKKYSVPLLVLLALFLFPAYSDQWRYSLMLAVSLLIMAFFGHVGMLAFSFDRRFLEQTFFFKCCIGQILLVLLWLVVSPLVFVYKVKLGLPLNLPILVAIFFVSACCYRKSGASFGDSLGYRDPIVTIFVFFAMICIFKIAAYYSLVGGALGLDTHQHIYYVNDLYEAAYLKVTARGTDFLGDYSKGLHVLVALWAAPGFGSSLGPAVKVMPALQTLLITFSFIEIAYQWLLQRGFGVLSRWIWLVLVLVVCCYGTFFGSRLIYPIVDLNSTGRISSAAVMLLPGIVGFAASLMPSRRIIALNWLLLPLCGALAVKINPSLAVAYIGFASIAWAFSAFNGVKGNMGPALVGLTIGIVVGSILIITDPYYLSLAAAGRPMLGNVLSWFNVISLEKVTSAVNIQGGVLSRFLHAVIQDIPALGGQRLTTAIYPNSDLLLNPGGAAVIRNVTLSAFYAWMLLLCFKSNQKNRLFTPRRSLMTFVIGLFAGCLVNVVLVKIAADTLGTETHETSLLASYALSYEPLLSMFLMQILCVLVITIAIDFAGILLGSRTWKWEVTPSKWVFISVYAVLAACTVMLMRTTTGYLPSASEMGWWNPIHGKDIREFRRVEKTIPDDGLILAEAVPAKLNVVEDWVLPVGPGTAYLPFAERKYVFNVKLGAGYKFGYSAMYDNFCTGNVAAAREFLKKNNIRYLFSPNSAVLGKDAFLNKTYCKISYRDLGIEFPAAFVGNNGIEFYRINVSST
jgi:hypothetical protein